MKNQKNEIWKDIPDYVGIYQCSSHGRIRSFDRFDKIGRFYKGQLIAFSKSTCYFKVNLAKNGKKTTFSVHQLVAICFLDHKPEGFKTVVDHIDGNRRNNHVHNLQVISQRENVQRQRNIILPHKKIDLSKLKSDPWTNPETERKKLELKNDYCQHNEVWIDVPEYIGIYQCSNFGRVRSLDRIKKNGQFAIGKILKQQIQPNGYFRTGLSKNGSHKKIEVHKLVAICFFNHKPNGFKIVVDHIDGNRTNNHVYNLQVITHRKNIQKRNYKGTSKFVGVYKSRDKWRVSICPKNKSSVCLGSYELEETAGRAYQIANRIIDQFQNRKQFRELVKSKI